MTTEVRSSRRLPPAAQAPRPLPADPGHGPLPLLLLALTVVTGLVDAVSILRLGRVFVANMTGNVVFTGFAVTGAPRPARQAGLLRPRSPGAYLPSRPHSCLVGRSVRPAVSSPMASVIAVG